MAKRRAKSSSAVREIAWSVLREPATILLRDVARAARENDLDPRDRALLRRLLGTEVRRRGTLRALLRRFASGRPDPDLAAHLHLGLVQVYFLDQVPDHAAVSETVSAVKRTLGPRKAGYANAVLRAALQARRPGISGDPRRDLPLRELHLSEPLFLDPGEHPLLWIEEALSIPAPLARGWVRRYGWERACELARGALVEPDLSLRAVDPPAEVASALEALGCRPRPGGHSRILLVGSESSEIVLRSEPFARGAVTVQGETSLRAAEMLEASPADRILDACSAPGGKTAVLAESGARVLACDSDPARLARVRGTLERLRPSGRVDLALCDGALGVAAGACDGVLLDVPCSNTGVLSQRPEARWRYSPAARRSLGSLQERLLDQGAGCVKPGGRLVYSTCSVEPDENRRRIEAFLARQPDFALEEAWETLPEPRGPRGPIDGGYAARLRRA